MNKEEIARLIQAEITARLQESRIDAEFVLTDINVMHAVQGRPGLFPLLADMGALDVVERPLQT
jgi:hypothetical protein